MNFSNRKKYQIVIIIVKRSLDMKIIFLQASTKLFFNRVGRKDCKDVSRRQNLHDRSLQTSLVSISQFRQVLHFNFITLTYFYAIQK